MLHPNLNQILLKIEHIIGHLQKIMTNIVTNLFNDCSFIRDKLTICFKSKIFNTSNFGIFKRLKRSISGKNIKTNLVNNFSYNG